jgi:hypothetical protein
VKKIFLPVLLIALLAGNAFAQVSGGVRVGGNVSNLKWDIGGMSVKDQSKFGVWGGMYLTTMFSDKLGLQPELAYSAMGSKAGNAKLKLGYLTLPVLLRYQVADQLHFLVGPQASFLLSAKYDGPDGDADVKDSFKSTEFGALLGIGFDGSRFDIGIRYGLGLADIDEDEVMKAKTRLFQIVVGYRLFGN